MWHDVSGPVVFVVVVAPSCIQDTLGTLASPLAYSCLVGDNCATALVRAVDWTGKCLHCVGSACAPAHHLNETARRKLSQACHWPGDWRAPFGEEPLAEQQSSQWPPHVVNVVPLRHTGALTHRVMTTLCMPSPPLTHISCCSICIHSFLFTSPNSHLPEWWSSRKSFQNCVHSANIKS